MNNEQICELVAHLVNTNHTSRQIASIVEDACWNAWSRKSLMGQVAATLVTRCRIRQSLAQRLVAEWFASEVVYQRSSRRYHR